MLFTKNIGYTSTVRRNKIIFSNSELLIRYLPSFSLRIVLEALSDFCHFPLRSCVSPHPITSIQAIAHFKRSWKILELKVVRIWFFFGSNKSPQPCYCTRKIFWLKKVAEKSYSLKHFWCRLLSIQYIFQRESRCSKKGIKIPCNRDFCGWWVKQWPI